MEPTVSTSQTQEKPSQLQNDPTQILGWGSDLDVKNRPAVPMENVPAHGTGAHWREIERQIPKVKIHKSSEHPALTPVFGTSCPPFGISGLLRDWAYRYSEGRTSHWLILLFADRVNVLEGRVLDLIQGKIAHPISESGLASEWKPNGFSSRLGQHRADWKRYRNEILLGLGAGVALWRVIQSKRERKSDVESASKKAA